MAALRLEPVVLEGRVVRQRTLTARGCVRASVDFSVLRAEWPRVEAHSEDLRARGRA